MFTPKIGKWSNLTNIFQMGWNHQPVYLSERDVSLFILFLIVSGTDPWWDMDTPQVIMVLIFFQSQRNSFVKVGKDMRLIFGMMGIVKSARTSNEDLCCPHGHGSLFGFVYILYVLNPCVVCFSGLLGPEEFGRICHGHGGMGSSTHWLSPRRSWATSPHTLVRWRLKSEWLGR